MIYSIRYKPECKMGSIQGADIADTLMKDSSILETYSFEGLIRAG